jgi:hypothetical protein
VSGARTRAGPGRPSLLVRVADAVTSLPPLLPLGLLTLLACWSLGAAALVLPAAVVVGLLALGAGPPEP